MIWGGMNGRGWLQGGEGRWRPWMRKRYVLDESPTLANLGNDHGFIIKEYYPYSYKFFWRSPKQRHESLCSKWTVDNIIPLWEIRVHLTVCGG